MEAKHRWCVEQSNTIDLALSNNLMLLDTVALTATVIVLTNERVFESLNTAALILIIISSVSVVASIFAGIVNYVVMRRFQQLWMAVNQRMVAQLSAEEMTPAEIGMMLAREQSNLPNRSNQGFWYVQITTLSLALLLYLAIIILTIAPEL